MTLPYFTRYYAVFNPLQHRTTKYHRYLVTSLWVSWIVPLSLSLVNGVLLHRLGPAVGDPGHIVCGVEPWYIQYAHVPIPGAKQWWPIKIKLISNTNHFNTNFDKSTPTSHLYNVVLTPWNVVLISCSNPAPGASDHHLIPECLHSYQDIHLGERPPETGLCGLQGGGRNLSGKIDYWHNNKSLESI